MALQISIRTPGQRCSILCLLLEMAQQRHAQIGLL